MTRHHRFVAASAALLTFALAPAPVAAGPDCRMIPYRAPETLRGADVAAIVGEPAPRGIARVARTSGNVHLLVVLAEFSDRPARIAASRFESLLFGPAPSVRDYWNEVSGGGLSVTGDVFGWVTLPRTQLSYSQGNGGVGAYPDNGQRMAEDAVTAATLAGVDLGSYDADGDGVVDALLVVHSGQGLEWSASRTATGEFDLTAIISHKWSVVNGELAPASAQVGEYFTCPELQITRSPGADSLATMGVYCHEFGHILGLPDYYDATTLENHLGPWDLMDFGGWGDSPEPGAVPGDLPAHLSAWSKAFLGWSTPRAIAPPAGEEEIVTVTLESATTGAPPLQLLGNAGGVDWKFGDPGTGEFFLAELRTRSGYDAGLPSEGLLVYHVDEARGSNDSEANPDGGRLLRVVPEDDGAGLATTATDPWPGAQSTFGPQSTPSSSFYGGAASGVTLRAISSVTNGRVTLFAEVENLAVPPPAPFARPNPWIPASVSEVELVSSAPDASGRADRVVVYDALGRRVRTIAASGDFDQSRRVARWDGARDDGRRAAAGVYFFRFEGAFGARTGRIVLLR